MRSRHALLLIKVLAVVWAGAGAASDAQACACCTNTGQRNVGVFKLDGFRLSGIGQVRFGPVAHLFAGEGDTRGCPSPATLH